MLEIYGALCEKRAGHAAAYGLLEKACRQHWGTMPPLAKTELGKPYFLDGSVEFSIAHTRTAAVCALCAEAVGVDVETVRPLREGVVKRCLTDEELRWLEAQGGEEGAFFRLWTAKEAWTKLLGTGLQGRPAAVDLRKALEEGFHFEFRLWAGAVVTVCTKSPLPATWRLP